MSRLITVLSVYYNAQDSMHTPYEAMMSQTYQNWEWIIADNQSTDNTLKILKEWAKKDSRIKIIARDKNEGYAYRALNEALPLCKGTHIQSLGMDDSITPDTLEEIVKRIDETEADVIIPDALIKNEFLDSSAQDFKMTGISPDKKDNKFKPNDRSVILNPKDAFRLSLTWRIHTWACFSKELMSKIKYLEEGMNFDEFSTREFLLNANKVAFSKGTYIYLRRPTSITYKLSLRYFGRFPVEEKLQELIRKNHIGRKYEKIVANSTLGIYFDYSMKYFTKKEIFTPEEQKQIEEILKYGKKLVNKYCSPFEILKANIKLLKYKTFYKLWKYLDNKLKQKRFI